MDEAAQINSILVAVPTMGGIMKSKTAESLFLLSRALARNNIHADIRNIDASDVVTVRNIYANMVLGSDRWNGLLFIDSDMQFLPRLVMKMIALRVDAAAVAYPKKKIELADFGAAFQAHGDLARARAESCDFNILLRWDDRLKTPIPRRGGFRSMAAAGMGCSLISRAALQAMVDGKAVAKRIDIRNSVREESWGFFDPVRIGQIILGEDFSFWYRWTKTLGRKLWVNVDEEVSHIGDFNYSGLFSALPDDSEEDEAAAAE